MASFSKGTSFTDGVTGDVTAAKLHALVDAATPVGGLVTDRTAKTSVVGADLALIADSADSNNLKKVSITNLANNLPTAVITDGTVTTLNSTTGTVTNLSTTLAGDFTITQGTGTIGTSAITTAKINDAAVTTAKLANPQYTGFRNRIINGEFGIAQRATSFVSGANNDDSYNLDRWYVLSDGNDAVDITQTTTEVPSNQLTAIALDVETTNKKFGIAQIIEQKNCIGLIGGNVTLSFKAKVSSTTKLDNVKAAVVAWSGTADTVTSDIISAWGAEGTNPTLIANATFENTPANLSVTTSYATYTLTANVDTASTKNIIVFIWSDVTDTTAGDFLYLTDVQLEAGSTATDFERRPIGTELALCQRYYYKRKFASGTFVGHLQVYFSAGAFGKIFSHIVPMRATPSSVGASSTSHFQLSNSSAIFADCSTLSLSGTEDGIDTGLTQRTGGGLTEGHSTTLRSNSNSAFIEASAEL